MEFKTCNKCELRKSINIYNKNIYLSDGLDNWCRSCRKESDTKKRAANLTHFRERDKERYRNNESRIINYKYKGIKDRCTRFKKESQSSAFGQKFLTRKQFDNWWVNNREKWFELQTAWKDSDYNSHYAPSIDRIDPRKSYWPENMQWITYIENCRKGTKLPKA